MRGDRFPPTARENSVLGVVDTEFEALVKGDGGLVVYRPGGESGPTGVPWPGFGVSVSIQRAGSRSERPSFGTGTPETLALSGPLRASSLQGRSEKGPDVNPVSIQTAIRPVLNGTRGRRNTIVLRSLGSIRETFHESWQ